MTIKFQPRFKSWIRFPNGKNGTIWNEKRVTITLFNIRIKIRLTNMGARN